MPDYLILLEGAWIVKDVDSVNDAASIAISEIGKRLNPKFKYVDFEVGKGVCPACKDEVDKVILVARTALVGILFKMKVYDAKNEKHASQIAKSVIGKALRDIPLKVVEMSEIKDG
ncbi:MAG: DUF555 domain-containing protein [Halobacteriota archaeon]|nr:DUF555 domain-containing protein [Halobacteriota archaeon]